MVQTSSRFRIHITGQVQGVGFRPHVYRIAHALQCTGFVFNHAQGVTIEIQGAEAEHFIEKLRQDLPPLAVMDSIASETIPFSNDASEFVIIQSQDQSNVKTRISPDVCICEDCLHELFDPKSRFYHYPFLNCTNCGPRLTIVKHLPYDRVQTTMQKFPFCDACRDDYSDPLNRRYHAQPTACSACGPHLSLSIEKIVQQLQAGAIVALKGMGGYQLICDARNVDAVQRLRQRKKRDAKPFALMALNVPSVKKIVECSEDAEKILKSWSRPIMLLPKLDNSLMAEIAEGLSTYGVMLPSTPLHYLLFHGLLGCPKDQNWLQQENDVVLVVTSANPNGYPLVIDDDQARETLKDIADMIVSYNRQILTRVDDSVVEMIDQQPFFIRRARGHVPQAIKLSHALPPGLAVGGSLKNTFCIVRDDEAFVSQYIGDLDDAPTIQFFKESLEHFLKLLDVKPEYVAHDLHPDFYSTQFAQSLNLYTIPVQHHHAHLAAVMAEHQIDEPVLGVSLDGYGYGEQGALWGGECMLLEGVSYQRLGSLKPIPQPGGDIGAREPWRMAASILYLLDEVPLIRERFQKHDACEGVIQLLQKNINTPLTSSCGRLFDAVSALLGVKEISDYEGQAAMQLESLVTDLVVFEEGWTFSENLQLDLLPLMEQLLQCNPHVGANLFHGTLIAALTDWIQQAAHETGMKKVVLTGGCFLNRILTENLLKALQQHGIQAVIPRQLPPTDGAISLGQIWIAGNHP